MRSPKIGALIPIRLASERLPNKAIKEICGKPIVCHLLDRAFACKYLEKKKVVVTTTREESDDKLVEVVEGYGASIFRGDTDDIIKRFYDAIREFEFDAVIEIDGDDICVDPVYMDYCLDNLLLDQNNDVTLVKGIPLGLAPKAISRLAFDKVIDRYQTRENDTGFMYFFTKTGLCRVIELPPISDKHIHKTARLTLDYPEDFAFFEALFNELYVENEIFGVEEIIELLNEKPELVAINSSLDKEYWKRTMSKTILQYKDKKGNIRKIKV